MAITDEDWEDLAPEEETDELLPEDVLPEDEETEEDLSRIVPGTDELDEIEQLTTQEQGISKPHPSTGTYGENPLTNTH